MTALRLRRLFLILAALYLGLCWIDQLAYPSPLPLLVTDFHRSAINACIPMSSQPLVKPKGRHITGRAPVSGLA